MPEGIAAMPPWLTGLFAGVMIAWATQALQAHSKRARDRHEKLLDAYADFVGALSSDLGRANSIDAMIELSGADSNTTEFLKQEEKRHELRKDLSRLAFRIRMLEKDKKLRALVDMMAKSQPFMVFALPPRRGREYFAERHMVYKSNIFDFKMSLDYLVDAVQRTHSDVLGPVPDPPE
jgi:hypothetical protein